jgi:hypothetical protein
MRLITRACGTDAGSTWAEYLPCFVLSNSRIAFANEGESLTTLSAGTIYMDNARPFLRNGDNLNAVTYT